MCSAEEPNKEDRGNTNLCRAITIPLQNSIYPVQESPEMVEYGCFQRKTMENKNEKEVDTVNYA